MSKPSLDSKSKPFCHCQKNSGCSDRPNVFSKVNSSSSSNVCNHGTRPKCSCADQQPKKRAGQLCTQDEPQPIPDPVRTASLLCVLKYDKSCNCKVVTRAVRADVHRYLGMVDRNRNITNKDPEPPVDSNASDG